MPTTLPQGFGDATKEGAGGGNFIKIRGIFEASIFELKRESHKRKGADVYYYSVDFRINEGEFDGEDIKGEYVGLYADAIFTLHDILVAIGELDTYYKRSEDGKSGQWVALPDEDDLRGKKLYIQVDNAPWQSSDRETKVGLVHQVSDPSKGITAGDPILREGNGISAYFPIGKPKPEYRERKIRPNLRKEQQTVGGSVPQVAGGFPGQVPADSASPWGGTGAAQAAQQPGTTGW